MALSRTRHRQPPRRPAPRPLTPVGGAERLHRIYLDKFCNKKFPVKFPPHGQTIFHRIIVARNATKGFREYVNGTGTLIIKPDIIGNDHLKEPFHVGRIAVDKGFIHIFDDIALNVVLKELDTITDLADYLTKKEKFIETGKLLIAAGEEELLAFFLGSADGKNKPDFRINDNDVAIIDEGFYSNLISLPQYINGKSLNRISYAWDRLIEHFAKHAFDSSFDYTSGENFDEVIIGLREMASENRVARRVLAKALIEKISSFEDGKRAVRVALSPTNNKMAYVFFILPYISQINYKEYREYRKQLLAAYCHAARILMSDQEIIVGIATDPPGGGGSEDLLYLDTRCWTDNDFKEADKIRHEFGLLLNENVKKTESRTYQYPIPD